MMGARHSCPVPSDSTSSSSLPEKGQDDSNQGPVDSYTQSQLSAFWIACACRQIWAGCRQVLQ
ncbi:hypothetical protein Taro_010336 [Colocasia esculenta]|uniref:Uncharacterized protein n=1 Tax=Colocasia esculenta TaxID=4460 RepID=A0A843U987_COLES|nr:hypothetical protein [Colocasia esculenta]